MFPQTHQILSNPVFSINTTLPAESRSQRLWMCFHEQLHKQKQRAFRHLRCQKTHFRHAANHRKTLYLSRFSGSYPFFTFCIKATHSTWVELMELMSLNFIIVSVRRNMSMSFLVIFEKLQLRKYIELLLSASKCLSMQCYLYCSRRITQYRHLCGQGLSDAGRQKPPPVRTV